MDDILVRVGRLEAATADIKVDVAALNASSVHLATKSDIGDLKALISSTETSVIKWIVGTAIACAGLAFAAARFIS